MPSSPTPFRSAVPEKATSAVVEPAGPDFGATVVLPGSKSLTNRALLIAGLARGESRLENVLDCDDSRYMIEALRKLGVPVEVEPSPLAPGTLDVTLEGAGGPFPVKNGLFFLGNAGTTTRFLTAALATSKGTYVIDGDERMRQRPIGELVQALRALGGNVKAPAGCPPVDIGPARLGGGSVNMAGSISSQFISAILMAAPLATAPTTVRLIGDPVSRPYLELTFDVMRAFRGDVRVYDKAADGNPRFDVSPSTYIGRHYRIEGDASAASYFFAAAAITGAVVRVEGVGRESLQGDLRCADVLAKMGCRVTKEKEAVQVVGADLLHGVDCDCSDMPDIVPTLAVVGLFARGKTRLRGVPHLRHKESDRIASVASELRKLGGKVKELDDGLEVHGAAGRYEDDLHGGQIRTWGDHRIAMAFSIAALRIPGVEIRDPAVVGKSFPGYWSVLASLGTTVSLRDVRGEEIERIAPEGLGS